MILFAQNSRVMIGLEAIDFRAGINKLSAVAKSVFTEDPMSGVLFVFRNKRSTDIKLIYYDGTGFFTGHKRLSRGKLTWWPRNERESLSINSDQLSKLLHGVDPRGDFHPDWPEYRDDEPQGSARHQYQSTRLAGPKRASPAGKTPQEGFGDIDIGSAIGRDAAELAIKAALEHLGLASTSLWNQD